MSLIFLPELLLLLLLFAMMMTVVAPENHPADESDDKIQKSQWNHDGPQYRELPELLLKKPADSNIFFWGKRKESHKANHYHQRTTHHNASSLLFPIMGKVVTVIESLPSSWTLLGCYARLLAFLEELQERERDGTQEATPQRFQPLHHLPPRSRILLGPDLTLAACARCLLSLANEAPVPGGGERQREARRGQGRSGRGGGRGSGSLPLLLLLPFFLPLSPSHAAYPRLLASTLCPA